VRCICLFLTACLPMCACRRSAVSQITFSQSTQTIEAYDFVEVTANVAWPRAQDCFTDATFDGWFESADGSRRWNVEGFCDSADGSVFRIRFMAPLVGDYKYSVEYRQGSNSRDFGGTFRASNGHRRGPLRVDPKYPWHFIWEGNGEHYFFNGTTAYWLMGWRDDNVIHIFAGVALVRGVPVAHSAAWVMPVEIVRIVET
jgi:hypothetical protein